jgi:hypothetical protein
MKGIPALIVAAGLGIVGFVLNFVYLSPASQQRDSVYFIFVKRGVTINRGDRLKAEDLQTVGIPREQAASLLGHVVSCKGENDLGGVEHQTVCRTLSEGSPLLSDDLRTPVQDTLELGKNEGVVWIPVDAKNFIPSLVTPGDIITFVVAAAARPSVPTPAARNDAGHGAAPAKEELTPTPDPDSVAQEPPGPTEHIGPFTILDVGNRLSSPEVFTAAHLQPQQTNVIGIRVRMVDKRMDDPLAKKLQDRLFETNYHTAFVIVSHKEGGR